MVREKRPMSVTHPHLVEEFDSERNAPLTPESLVAGTNKKLHWICKTCSHQWSTSGTKRAYQGTGCPSCSGKVVHSDGRNSISITHPKLAEEFDIERNAPLTPDMVKYGSYKKVFWRCSECSHEWLATPNNRSSNRRGCPACSNQAVHSDGRNSLRTINPNLAEEFDIVKNAPLTPETVVAGSSRRLHWICSECSHKWVAQCGSRNSNGRGCPACSNQAIHNDGRNSMQSTHPHLASEFDMEENFPLTPETIIAGTNKKLHWICRECSHNWIASGNKRVGDQTGCPSCSGNELHSDGRNSMRNTHPHLAIEFDMQGNAPLTPDTIKAGTNMELHWICSECSHHWKSPGNNRTPPQSSGCPVCANKVVHEDGRNSLRNTHPELAKEFSVEKNYPITADMIVAGSNKKFHWICISCQHEWKAVANSRLMGRGCPMCAETGFNPGIPASYYLIEIRNEEDDVILYKGGISRNSKIRFAQHRSNFAADNRSKKWNLRLIESIDFEVGEEALNLEKRLLKAIEIRAPNINELSTELFLENPLDYARKRKWV